LKIADSEHIKSGEKDLIDSITADLDWDSLEKLIEERHRFKLQDDVEYKSGDMLVYEDKVAYKLDFDIKVSLSVIFDRNGNCLNLETSDVNTITADSDETESTEKDDGNMNQMASQIADMIQDINKD